MRAAFYVLLAVVFLPLVLSAPDLAEPKIGVATWAGRTYSEDASGLDFTRVHRVLYKDYGDESKLDVLRKDIESVDNEVHLHLFGTPDGSCRPLQEDEFEGFWEYSQWILDSVGNVDVIYVLNEPDAESGHPDHYGCHGDPELFYSLMAYMYPRLRSYGLEVRIGGLMLDEKSDLVFLQELLDLGIEKYTDKMPVHHYAFYGESFGGTWNLRKKLEDVMAMTGLTVVLEETNLLCEGSTCGRGFHLAQAAYVAYAVSTAYDMGVPEVLIYCLCKQPGWKNAALYDISGAALPSLEYLRALED